jgi:peroxiredoxin
MKNPITHLSLICLAAVINLNTASAQTFTTADDSATVKVKIQYNEMTKKDRLVLYYTNVVPVPLTSGQSGIIITMAKKLSPSNFEFQFRIPNKSQMPGIYFTITKVKSDKNEKGDSLPEKDIDPSYDLIRNSFIEAGDDLIIYVLKKPQFDSQRSPLHNFIYKYEGIGSEKFTIRHEIDSIRYSKDFQYDYMNTDSTFNNRSGELKLASYLTTLLIPYKGKISSAAYDELLIHSYFSAKVIANLGIRYYLKRQFKNASEKTWLKMAKDIEQEDVAGWWKFDKQALTACYDFGEAELEKYHTIGYCRNKNWVPDSLIHDLTQISDPLIRERLMILAAKVYSFYFNDYTSFLMQCTKYIQSKESREQFAKLVLLKKGAPAYNFSLTDLNGKKVTLAEFKGKVVFIDFWYTGCENCSNYYHKVLSNVEEKFRSNPNYVFLSVSIDKNMKLWKNSVMTHTYTSEQVKNLYTNGQGPTNDIITFMNVSSYPSPFIIDRHQKIFDMGLTLRDEQPLINTLQAAAKN